MELFNLILRVVLIFLIIFIERKKPGEALIWVLLVFVFPLAGGILYLILGSTLGIKLTHRMRSRSIYKPFLEVLDIQLAHLKDGKLPQVFSQAETQMVHFNLRYSEGGIGFSNAAEILSTGKGHYGRLLEDIANAKQHIHLAFYSIHHDRVGKEFVAALVRKAQEGVEVRVLCDAVGSLGAKTFLFGPLIKVGGKVKTIKPLLTHFRFHRKIVMIDGRIGYTGGMNIGCKYLGENAKKTPWRDTQVRILGDSVLLLQYYFLYDWLFANWKSDISGNPSKLAQYFPEQNCQERLPCQIIGSGVETDKQTIKLSYMRMISLAQKRVVMQTPYFIPSVSLLDELKSALSSGVEVILQIPGQKASFFLDPVTRYFIAQLVPLGLRVYYYEGYLHAKTLRIDNSITCIGSVNIDIRSLEVDDEICAVFYDEAFAQQFDGYLAKDVIQSKEMNYDAFSNRGLTKKAAERIFHLFSPFM